METSALPKTSIIGLVRSLTDEIRNLLRQEAQLAKAEMSEKVAHFASNAVAIATGGAVAGAGAIVFLIGLGWLAAWGLQKAGLEPALAAFVGLASVGVLVAIIGACFLFRGIKALSKDSLAPERTIHTIQKLKGEEQQTLQDDADKEEPKASSKELQASVEATEERMTETLDELGYRLSPSRIKARVEHRIQENPYRAGLVAIAAGLVSGLFLSRDSRRS